MVLEHDVGRRSWSLEVFISSASLLFDRHYPIEPTHVTARPFASSASALSASTPLSQSTPPTTSSHPHLNRLVMADSLEYNRHEGEKDEEEEEEEIDDTVGTMLV